MDKLSEFVKEQIQSGVKPAELKDHLIKNGWNESDVTSAINSAQGGKIKNRIMIAVIGIVLIGILAFVLVSYAKNTNPNVNINQPPVTINTDVELTADNPVDECALKEDGTEKDECYKILLKTEFDCDTLEDNIEYTYCLRAYEDISLQDVERIDEG